MTTPKFSIGNKVRYTVHGVEVEGEVVSGLEPFYPDSTVTKYGAGSMGRRCWGYKVRGPIVSADGSIYMVRGQMAPGRGYVDANDLEMIG